MKSFHLKIATPDALVFDGEAESLLVKTTEGDLEILAKHADFLAALATGKARLLIGGETKLAAASGGFISVKQGEVSLVCTTFEFADEIDVRRAKSAKEEAEAKLSTVSDKNAEAILKAKLLRAMNRINVGELNR